MNRYAKPSNFGHPVRTPLLREHFVYRTFNAAGELLYIGCSRDWQKRLEGHKDSRAEWYPLMVRVKVEGPYNYETARQVERDAIESERSLFNYNRERRALDKLKKRLVEIHARHLTNRGVPFVDALTEAVQVADELMPVRNRSAVRLTDMTVPHYRRMVADYAQTLEVAS